MTCIFPSISVVQWLLNNGAQVNSRKQDGSTALIWAVRQEKTEVVQLLLKKGADAKLKDKSGKSALDYAKEVANENLVQLLKR